MLVALIGLKGCVPFIPGSAGSQDNYPMMKCSIPFLTMAPSISGYNLFYLLGILIGVATKFKYIQDRFIICFTYMLKKNQKSMRCDI